jgi:hypothetical protein
LPLLPLALLVEVLEVGLLAAFRGLSLIPTFRLQMREGLEGLPALLCAVAMTLFTSTK